MKDTEDKVEIKKVDRDLGDPNKPFIDKNKPVVMVDGKPVQQRQDTSDPGKPFVDKNKPKISQNEKVDKPCFENKGCDDPNSKIFNAIITKDMYKDLVTYYELYTKVINDKKVEELTDCEREFKFKLKDMHDNTYKHGEVGKKKAKINKTLTEGFDRAVKTYGKDRVPFKVVLRENGLIPLNYTFVHLPTEKENFTIRNIKYINWSNLFYMIIFIIIIIIILKYIDGKLINI